MRQKQKHAGGFTLIEVMVALLITGVVAGAGYAAYRANLRSYMTQQQIVDMQQNIRAAFYYMSTDMRMAGYKLAGNDDHLGVSDPYSSQVTLKMDLDGDGNITGSEQVSYSLAGGSLVRNGVELARNIDALNFVYLTEDEDGDGRGDVLPDESGGPPDASGDPTSDGMPDEPDKIRSIEVTVVARAGDKELGLTQQFTDDRTYRNQRGSVILDKSPADQQDKFRRRLYSSVFMCRNMGLSTD